MDKNFITAILLMILVLFVHQMIFSKPEPPAVPEEQQEATTDTPATEVSGAPSTPPPPGTSVATTDPALQADAGAESQTPAFNATPQVAIKSASVDTGLYTATVSNDGGVITSWMLKSYKDKAGKDGVPYEMIWTAGKGRYAFATEFGDTGLDLQSTDDYEFVEKQGNRIVLRRTTPTGIEATKIFDFDPDNYSVAVTLALKNISAIPVQGVAKMVSASNADPMTGGSCGFTPPPDFFKFQAYINNKLETEQVAKVETREYPGTELSWSGFTSKYFLMGVAPEFTTESKLSTRRASADLVESVITSFNKRIEPNQSQEYKFICYLGPKLETNLHAIGHGFEWSRDYGWFSGIARFLVRVLNFFQKYVGNYGVAILILTFIIKIVLLPLTHKSYKSMKAMQKLQPEMKMLREQYGNDKNMLNQKMMELYKTHKVNPASGCLPMLIQLPIFIAFYRALDFSIELRHSPFYGWIQDLSAPDPLYITPILMGASMVITQKMTPSSADPMQQKMMMAMPIVFTFMFLNFPAGLVIYWLMSNILSIFQQIYINRMNDDEPGPAVAEAGGAKRKKRK